MFQVCLAKFRLFWKDAEGLVHFHWATQGLILGTSQCLKLVLGELTWLGSNHFLLIKKSAKHCKNRATIKPSSVPTWATWGPACTWHQSKIGTHTHRASTLTQQALKTKHCPKLTKQFLCGRLSSRSDQNSQVAIVKSFRYQEKSETKDGSRGRDCLQHKKSQICSKWIPSWSVCNRSDAGWTGNMAFSTNVFRPKKKRQTTFPTINAKAGNLWASNSTFLPLHLQDLPIS